MIIPGIIYWLSADVNHQINVSLLRMQHASLIYSKYICISKMEMS